RWLNSGLHVWLLLGHWQRRRRGPVHSFQRLLVDLRRSFRDRLDLDLGLNIAQGIGRQIEVAQVLALLDGVERIDDCRNLEHVFWNPGDCRKNQYVNEDGEPDAFAQTSPTPLIFEVADHLK